MCEKGNRHSESGAALPAVLFVSSLLLVGSAFLLTSVGYQSQNASDVLNETKAYYAAESGVQATINVMRFGNAGAPVLYSDAVASEDLALGEVPSGFVYDGNGRVAVGSEASFKVIVWDPDNTKASTRYSTIGSFRQSNGTYATSRVFTDTDPSDPLITRKTTFSFTNQAETTVTHPMAANGSTPFGTVQMTKENGGAAIDSALFPIKFRVDYLVSGPAGATRTFYGQITSTGAVTFSTGYSYELGGGQIDLCSSTTCPSSFSMSLTLAAASATGPLYGHLTPMEPYRLAVRSTGFANGAEKRLDSVLQRNYFNNIGAAAAITMLGPGGPGFTFDAGSSSQMQIDGVSVPSVVVSDPTALGQVNTSLQGPPDRTSQVVPAPEVAGSSLPEWQQSPADMEEFLAPFRSSALHDGQLKPNGTTLRDGDFGSYDTGLGLTYCDGDCTVAGNGGGVLIVRGTLTLTGNPMFKGIIIVTGLGGVTRSGGGNKFTLSGNLIIAPYDPNDLQAGFLAPSYDVNGGPGEIEYNDVDLSNTFNNTSGVSNFILGIAEK